jgi:hypothetical protein
MVCETIGAPTKMIWGTGVFTKFSIELKDEDGKPHKVHLVANLRIDGKRCWGLKIPMTPVPHIIFVGAPIVLAPPTKADDL